MLIEVATKIQGLVRENNFRAAEFAATKLRQTHPKNSVAWQISGDLAARQFKFPEARAHYERAVALDSGVWGAWNNLANVYRYLRQMPDWQRCLYTAIRLCPDPEQAARLHSNLILHLHSNPAATQASIIAELHAWSRAHLGASPVATRVLHAVRSTTEPIRVAYVSGAFGSTIFLRALPQVVRHHHLREFAVDLVNTSARVQERPADYDCQGVGWRNAPTITDYVALAGRYDLVVDLDGHSPTGRPLWFQQRIAPTQVSWLDWFNSTALPTMDYFLGDAVSTPPEVAETFSEQVLLLPSFRLCFDPHPYSKSAVLRKTGHRPLTFGVFGRVDKHSDQMLNACARVLRAAHATTMTFKASGFDVAAIRESYRSRFAANGIDPSRVSFLGATSYEEHLHAYTQVDVMLDTFPYNGGITTLDALSMGIPTVSILGEHPVARQSAAILQAVGLSHFVGTKTTEYEQIAVQIATGQPFPAPPEPEALRQTFLSSPLVDAYSFAGALEAAYRKMVDDQPEPLGGGRG